MSHAPLDESRFEPELPVEIFRQCACCRREKPITAFAKDHRGVRIFKCAVCAGGYDAAALRAKKNAQKHALSLLVAKLRGNAINAPHISELTEQMVALFGDTEGLAIAWKQQIDEAIKAKPGSKTVLDSFWAIAKLIQLSTENRHSAPDLEGMSDEEITAELQDMMRKLIPVEVQGELSGSGQSEPD